jgi:hypothetical protein
MDSDPDAQRLRPGQDQTAVTAGQVRDVVTRLIAAGHWRDGDQDIVIVFDGRLRRVSPGVPVG